MALRLNPRYPLVWRTPDCVQLGVDHAIVTIDGLTLAHEAVLSALAAGVHRSGAMLLGTLAGASAAEVTHLLELLAPALLYVPDDAPTPVTPLPRTVLVDGVGPTAFRVRTLLANLGIEDPLPGNEPDLAVLVGQYVFSPERHGHWLRRDIPHLPVVFSDSAARVGPLVEPGQGPCLTCLELAHVDSDPAWPAMACQLAPRQAPSETPRLSFEVAARVAGLVQDRLETGQSAVFARSLRIDAVTGTVTRSEHRLHERCGCQALAENETVPEAREPAHPRTTS
ncbi:TOMM precursor leader peptide-binding protein [Cryobacterium aureum]|uniref:TOMM precursor leader peptide-binding protein n=1 Tax=Cryobacterium aureum TaxID=995037 RepID=UPI00101AD90C|nr:TOMM precursor leader peptide-binding protein [Cryobacterium aureum]